MIMHKDQIKTIISNFKRAKTKTYLTIFQYIFVGNVPFIVSPSLQPVYLNFETLSFFSRKNKNKSLTKLSI